MTYANIAVPAAAGLYEHNKLLMMEIFINSRTFLIQLKSTENW